MISDRLSAWAEERGFRVAAAPAGILDTVRDKLEKRRDGGSIDRDFFRKNLEGFRYRDDCGIAGSKAVVMVAVPRPTHILPLVLDGRRIEGVIPPTYVEYRRTFSRVFEDLKENVLGNDMKGEILNAPLKSLAVHMGLVSYGRNNVTYVPEFGSGLQLCGYMVGIRERLKSDRGEETAMDLCDSCRACVKACPTGAIRDDRFIISAERCYTLFSEQAEPMPPWVKPPASPSICLVGCMACQEACPMNKGRLKYKPSGIEFTAEETEAVIEAGWSLESGMGDIAGASTGAAESKIGGQRGLEPDPAAWASAKAKFETLGTSEDIKMIGRNIRIWRHFQSKASRQFG